MVALLSVGFFRLCLKFGPQLSDSFPLVFMVGTGTLALALSPVRYAELPRRLSILIRGCGVVALIYIVGARLVAPLPPDATAAQLTWSLQADYLYWLALGSATLSFVRPALVVLPAVFLVWSKRIAASLITGLPNESVLDVQPIAEVMVFVTTALILWDWSRRVPAWLPDSPARALQTASQRLPGLIFVVAIASHFANYFYSGLQKLLLDGPPLAWVWANDPSRIMLVALDNGHIIFQGFAEFTALVVNVLHQTSIPANAVVLFFQLSAIAVFYAGSRFLIALTVFFDVLHVAIFFTVGANFWPWVGFNITILAAFAGYRLASAPASVKLYGTLAILASPWFFSTAWLGWYDTGANNKHFFVAVDVAGNEYEVPPNYWLSYSYAFGHMRYGSPPGGVQYPTGSNGSSTDFAVLQAGLSCDFSGLNLEDPYPFQSAALRRFVRGYHAYVLNNLDADGHFDYDLYLHHFFGPPSETAAFRELDKRRIVAYVYRTESVCLQWDGAHVDRQLLATSSYLIDVAP